MRLISRCSWMVCGILVSLSAALGRVDKRDAVVPISADRMIVTVSRSLSPEMSASTMTDQLFTVSRDGKAHFRFRLSRTGDVQLVVFDVLGNPVSTLISQWMRAGNYEITWDGTGTYGKLPRDIYLARLETASGDAVAKVELLD
jgi:hypothetical protein